MACSFLISLLMVIKHPTLDLLAYPLALGWRGEWAPSRNLRRRTIKNTFLIFWNTRTWDEIVRLQETFSLLFSQPLAEFPLSLSLCFSCNTCVCTMQFFLSCVLCIWVKKLLTLVQLGLGLFSNLGFGCIFINVSNPWNLFIKILTSV